MAEAIVKDANLVIDQKAFTQMIGSLETINKSIQSMGSITEKTQDKLEEIEENTGETGEETEKSGNKLSGFISWMKTTEDRAMKARKAAAGMAKATGKWVKDAAKGLGKGFWGALFTGGFFLFLAYLLNKLKDVDFVQLRKDAKEFMEKWWPKLVTFWADMTDWLSGITITYESVIQTLKDVFDWMHAFNRAWISLPIMGAFMKGGKGMLGAAWGIWKRMWRIFGWFDDLLFGSKDIDNALKNKKIKDIPIKKRMANLIRSFNNFIGDVFKALRTKFKNWSLGKKIKTALGIGDESSILMRGYRRFMTWAKILFSSTIGRMSSWMETKWFSVADNAGDLSKSIDTAGSTKWTKLTKFINGFLPKTYEKMNLAFEKKAKFLWTAEDFLDAKAAASKAQGPKGWHALKLKLRNFLPNQWAKMNADVDVKFKAITEGAELTGDSKKGLSALTRISTFLNTKIFGKTGIIGSTIGTEADLKGVPTETTKGGKVVKGLKFAGTLIGGLGNILNAILPFKWIFRPFMNVIFTVIDAMRGILSPESFLGKAGEDGRKYGVPMKRVKLENGDWVEVPDPSGMDRALGGITAVIGGFFEAGQMVTDMFGMEKDWAQGWIFNVGQFLQILAKSSEIWEDMKVLFGVEDMKKDIKNKFMVGWDDFMTTWEITVAKMQLNLMKFLNATADIFESMGWNDAANMFRAKDSSMQRVREVIDQGTGSLLTSKRRSSLEDMLMGKMPEEIKDAMVAGMTKKMMMSDPKMAIFWQALNWAGSDVAGALFHGSALGDKLSNVFTEVGPEGKRIFSAQKWAESMLQIKKDLDIQGSSDDYIKIKMGEFLVALKEAQDLSKEEKAAAVAMYNNPQIITSAAKSETNHHQNVFVTTKATDHGIVAAQDHIMADWDFL